MKRKNWKNLEKEVIYFWISEKKALALKLDQFRLENISKSQIKKILRKLRKKKLIFYGYKRWGVNLKYQPYREIYLKEVQ